MWEIAAVEQGRTLLYAFCWGAGLGVFYDFFRVLRRCGWNSIGATAISDVIFWVVSGFATFFLLLARENGELRLYVLLGELAGGVLFRLTVSRLLFAPTVAAFRFLVRCGGAFRHFLQKIGRLAAAILAPAKKTFKKCAFWQKNA